MVALSVSRIKFFMEKRHTHGSMVILMLFMFLSRCLLSAAFTVRRKENQAGSGTMNRPGSLSVTLITTAMWLKADTTLGIIISAGFGIFETRDGMRMTGCNFLRLVQACSSPKIYFIHRCTVTL